MQNWHPCAAQDAFVHLRWFVQAHSRVFEYQGADAGKEAKRASRNAHLDAARDEILAYARIAEQVSVWCPCALYCRTA